MKALHRQKVDTVQFDIDIVVCETLGVCANFIEKYVEDEVRQPAEACNEPRNEHTNSKWRGNLVIYHAASKFGHFCENVSNVVKPSNCGSYR